jgi:ribose transport system substrate-binding protein
MLPGMAGVSVAETRIATAKQVFANYPDIKILDLQYTDWSPAKGKQVMASLLQTYGDQIDGVWSDHGLQGSGALEAFVEAGWEKGKIPPITCADLNGCVKLAVENDVPAFNYDYPPAMGGVAVNVALDILAGKPVPKQYEMSVDITITKGDETESVKADKWVEDYARLDKPNDLILSTGIPDYDPSNFSADFPK